MFLGLPLCCHSPAIIACLQTFIRGQACTQSPGNNASTYCCTIEGMEASGQCVLFNLVYKREYYTEQQVLLHM